MSFFVFAASAGNPFTSEMFSDLCLFVCFCFVFFSVLFFKVVNFFMSYMEEACQKKSKSKLLHH